MNACALLLIIICISTLNGFRFHMQPRVRGVVAMALDTYVADKLNNLVRNFDALTERLADPDVANDRKQLLSISRERSSLEDTVLSYASWKELETERLELTKMEQSPSSELDLKELAREEIRNIIVKQDVLEKNIMLLLLPRDPNDDRNVMLEIRSGTGGDEAGIFAGDLVSIYRKYCEAQDWKVVLVSESAADMGGYKTCILQVTGSYVYSKLKYEVRFLFLFRSVCLLSSFFLFNACVLSIHVLYLYHV